MDTSQPAVVSVMTKAEVGTTGKDADPCDRDVDGWGEPMVKITMIDDARLKTFREQFLQSNK